MISSLGRASRRRHIPKRAFDIAIAAVSLVMAAPVMGAIAIAIKADSSGPVLFRQQRVGRGGTLFSIHKFRTMRPDAGALISASTDPRITTVGAILRRTKLDELPQLVDVLVGAMSLVGPRPEVPRYVALWPDDAREIILSVRPGVTDPASVLLRHESDDLARAADPESYYVESLLPLKTAMYVDYVRSQTFVGDLRVLGATLLALAR